MSAVAGITDPAATDSSPVRHVQIISAAHASCMIIMIIVCAKVFGYFFTLAQATQAIVAWVGSLDISRWVILVCIMFGYVVLGCLMDQVAILILTVPVVLPLVKALGFDPVWFGVLVIVVAEVGLVTPPVGLNVFVVSRYAKRPLQEIFAGVWPHVVSHLMLLVVLAAFPSIILWLPTKMAP
jgi:TRAP-type C4-dicarboxylate transport system permease large subunit